jgi:glycosyltransferase involved in cell wall biosynthesis
MRAADALVSPMTEVKAVPMKLYAYLSAGRPIVATALPNHEQILTGGTALLVPPRPDALADSLCRVFENPELARRLSSATRGLADERIDARDCGEALALAYAKVRAPAKERELPARSSRSAPRSALLQESL